MIMVRRLGPWVASAALHAGLGAAAYFAVAQVGKTAAPDPDAVYTVSIRPGGSPQIGEIAEFEGTSYGVTQETVTIGETPLDGVPELPLTSSEPAPSKTGTGFPARVHESGPVARFGTLGGGGSPGTSGKGGTGAGDGKGVGEGRDEGVEAVPLETPSPVYPDPARRAQVQGVVIAEIKIDTQGRVESARAAQSSGSALLDDAAVAAVKSWRYKPATLGGKPVSSLRRVRFVFRLE